MYPQITDNGLQHPGSGFRAAITTGYDVVQSAWKDYMEHDNHGRGVVVIGHSQGSTMAQELLRTQIDSNAHSRSLLVSAIIPGGNVVVPIGKQVGGTFQHLGACTAPTQLHCIVAYSSFDQTPPAGTLFGMPGRGVSLLQVTPSPTKGMQVLCVNPAALSTGRSGVLQPYFPRNGTTSGRLIPWTTQPNLYSGRCMYENGTTWLQVNAPIVAGDPSPGSELGSAPRRRQPFSRQFGRPGRHAVKGISPDTLLISGRSDLRRLRRVPPGETPMVGSHPYERCRVACPEGRQSQTPNSEALEGQGQIIQ